MTEKIIIENKNYEVIVKLEGNFSETSTLMKIINKFYENKNIDKIIIDTEKLIFLSSSTLGVFVYFHTMMKKENRKIIFVKVNMNSLLDNIFKTTGLNEIMNIEH